MKLWSKGGEEDPAAERIYRFTASRDAEFDHYLAYWDVLGSLAHVQMLANTGILPQEDAALLIPALEELLQKAEKGELLVEPGVEDIHSQVELLLTRQLGEAGKKIHAARSRNDQVLLDIKLFLRYECLEIQEYTVRLAETFLQLAEKHQKVLLPGYTHMQVAMPSSFGLWFGAWAECLAEDLWSLLAAYRLINKNPLGSAAGFGSSFPIDREDTTRQLGFADLHWNVVNAQLSRGRTEKMLASGMAQIASTLGRFSMEMVMYLGQDMGFLQFPPALTTGSSIMPHKKNPDVFELIRAKCNRMQALPQEISLMLTNLPSGYHRDFQLIKEHLFPAIMEMKEILDMTRWMLEQVQINDKIAEEKYRYLFTVEEVNRLVLEEGKSFREAYVLVGQAVENGAFSYTGIPAHSHQGSLGNLCLDEIHRQLEQVQGQF